jgi:hypothetical protein
MGRYTVPTVDDMCNCNSDWDYSDRVGFRSRFMMQLSLTVPASKESKKERSFHPTAVARWCLDTELNALVRSKLMDGIVDMTNRFIDTTNSILLWEEMVEGSKGSQNRLRRDATERFPAGDGMDTIILLR